MTIEQKKARYLALAHALQTGVAYKMEKDASDTAPKHLRVGVNMALVQHSALVLLLMEKGVITEDEYWDAQIEALEREVQSYQQELQKLYGVNSIKLG